VNLLEELDDVIEEVSNAKTVRFSASAMINKQSLLERLERIRKEAPEVLQQAQHVVRDRDGLLKEIQRETDQMVAEAKAEQMRLVAKTEVMDAAKRQAQKVVESAHQRANELRTGAEDFVDSRLASFEVVLQKTLAVVTKGRESIKGTLDVSGARVPTDEPGETA